MVQALTLVTIYFDGYIGSPEFMVGARSAPTINSMFWLFDL
jgi:hypothetical protein